MYKTEEEFLKNYDVSIFDQLSMTTDILLISINDESVDNYRKTSKKVMSILLVKRNDYPFKDKWCLPGGFVNPKTETLESCARRVLKEETNLTGIYLEQLYTFDSLDRDPRTRVVSTSFMALVDKKKIGTKLNEASSWFNVFVNEENEKTSIYFDNGQENFEVIIKKEIKEATTESLSLSVLKNDNLAFDHAEVILTGLYRLKNKIEYTDIVFNMMPKYFTLGELQQVYEVILNKKLLDPAFRRIISSKVVKTEKMKTGEGHRPSYLFMYRK